MRCFMLTRKNEVDLEMAAIVEITIFQRFVKPFYTLVCVRCGAANNRLAVILRTVRACFLFFFKVEAISGTVVHQLSAINRYTIASYVLPQFSCF